MPLLFQPIQFGDLNLTNKIVIAPMCQYSANDAGELSYWHEQQWANRTDQFCGFRTVE